MDREAWQDIVHGVAFSQTLLKWLSTHACRRDIVIASPPFCVLLILFLLFFSIMNALLHSPMALRLSFSRDLELLHSFCEFPQVINLAFSDTLINNILIHFMGSLFGGVSVSGTIFWCTLIVSSVLRMSSMNRKYKAFSTFGSHLLVVSLFCWTAHGVYISSAVTGLPRKIAVVSLRYIVVLKWWTHLFTSFIYSLRNRDKKESLRKLIDMLPFLFCDYIVFGGGGAWFYQVKMIGTIDEPE